MTGPGSEPTPRMRLSDTQRSRIAEQWDADAVEKIANLLSPEDRRSFMEPLGGVPDDSVQVGASRPGDAYFILTHPNPEIQELLEQMWAPFWETLPADALTNEGPGYRLLPGRKLALARRAARSAGGTSK
ncbi:MAG: hypothetical protein JWM95_125 [Gemmatimonadetes bacterium]|nr:hypothetical protein [Gemmatimonadota bacterium]